MPKDKDRVSASRNTYKISKDLFDLTQREYEVLKILASGKTNQEIANETHTSVNTVKSHIKKIYKKLNAKNRIEAIIKAYSFNLIEKLQK